MILFALRGLAVSLSVFVLAYAALRLAVACGWTLTRQRSRWLSPNALYALQIGPFVLAAMIVGAFTIPSFVRFEPRVVQEAFGPPVVFLSLICFALFGVGLFRAYKAYARTTRIVKSGARTPLPSTTLKAFPSSRPDPMRLPSLSRDFGVRSCSSLPLPLGC